ncbi:hypothetical protein [Cereibacter changlensis]|uniref:hypothetical protein n=1 Tax=Cereibacter changlensis TaxID=402884 RepID=UPI004034CA95
MLDQADIMSEIVAGQLGTWVGNVAAGSWGPENQLKYLRAHGTFNASTLIFIWSTHDISDVPRFCDELGPDFPTHKPFLATWEAISRYLPQYVPFLSGLRGKAVCPQELPEPEREILGQTAIRDLLSLATFKAAKVLVILHPELNEGGGRERELLRTAVQQERVTLIDMEGKLEPNDYLDRIHLSKQGHRKYARMIMSSLIALEKN